MFLGLKPSVLVTFPSTVLKNHIGGKSISLNESLKMTVSGIQIGFGFCRVFGEVGRFI